MAVDETDLFEEPQNASPEPRRRRRSRTRTDWSPDELLDPMVLIASAPMALFPERFPREAFLIAAALLVVPYAVRKSNTGRFTAPTPVLWPILLLVVAILPFSIWTFSGFDVVNWAEFVRFVWGMAVLLGVINWCAAGTVTRHSDSLQSSVTRHVAIATVAWFALGTVFTAVGLLALRSSSKVPLFGAIVEMLPAVSWLPESVAQGFNANRVAGLAVLFLPFAIALALAPAGRNGMKPGSIAARVVVLLLALFFGAVLLLTQSRTALLAAGFSVILVSLLAGRRGLAPLLVVVIVIVATLDVFGVAGLVDTFSVGDTALEGNSLVQRVLADRNMSGRVIIWRRALHGIADEPLTGMGLAGFEQRSQQLYPAMPDWQPDPDVVHAHNLYLQMGLDLGLPGLLALLGVIGVAIWEAVYLFRGSRPSSPARFWAIGASGALMAFVLYNMLDAVTVGARPAVSYWYLLGLIAGAGVALRLAYHGGDSVY